MRLSAAESIDRSNNCLNLIRLLAALQVVFGHSVEHLKLPFPTVLVQALAFFRGVPVFFAMSGFLIWNSLDHARGGGGYLKRRFWRIYPELWAAVAVELLAIVWLYFDEIDWPWFVVFAFTQSTFLQFWTPDFLRGYGIGAPNGSLWTICVLVQFYIAVLAVHKVLHKKRPTAFLLVALLSIGVTLLEPVIQQLVPEIIFKLYKQTLIPYFWIFFLGIIFAEYADALLPVLRRYWWCFAGISAVFLVTKVDFHGSYPIFTHVFQIAALLGFAYAFPGLEIKMDISYGLYLYHMTVVNVMVTFGMTGNVRWFIFAMLVSCILAYISTKTIGRFAMRKKAESAN